MFWFAIAAVALSAAAAKKQANAANTANANGYVDSLKSTEAENQAIMEANTQNVIRTGYRLGIQNMQRARAKQQAADAGFAISTQGVEAMGAFEANAAAAGNVGSSVDAVQGNIQKKVDEAQIDVDVSFMELMENMDLEREQIIMQGQDAIRSSRKVNTTLPTEIDGNQAALFAGAQTALSMYASNKMSLGLPQNGAAVSGGYQSVMGGLSTGYNVGGFQSATKASLFS